MVKKLEFKVNESRIGDFLLLGKILGIMNYFEREDIKDQMIDGQYWIYQEIKPYLETARGSPTIKKAMKEVERIYRKHVKAYDDRIKGKKR